MIEKRKFKLTKIVAMHYVKLIFRSLLFLSALSVYIYNSLQNTTEPFGGLDNNHYLLGGIWVSFVIGMTLRFFPSKMESMGCQKQFERNYNQTESDDEIPCPSGHSYITVAICWLILNGILGVLYLTGIFDRGIMLLIALFYSVCDVICILFFCPFQTWIMKNKCCTTCRIYNWDYAMMFTPLIFVKSFYSWSLFGMALALLIKWEYKAHKHPRWFDEQWNTALRCYNCKERLCQHKVQLQDFLMKGKFNLKGNFLYKIYNEKKGQRG